MVKLGEYRGKNRIVGISGDRQTITLLNTVTGEQKNISASSLVHKKQKVTMRERKLIKQGLKLSDIRMYDFATSVGKSTERFYAKKKKIKSIKKRGRSAAFMKELRRKHNLGEFRR